MTREEFDEVHHSYSLYDVKGDKNDPYKCLAYDREEGLLELEKVFKNKYETSSWHRFENVKLLKTEYYESKR